MCAHEEWCRSLVCGGFRTPAPEGVSIAGGSRYPSSEAERQRRWAARSGDKGEAGKSGAVQAWGFSSTVYVIHWPL